MNNLTEDIRRDLTKIFSERNEVVAEEGLQDKGTYILQLTIRCAFDGTLEEAQEKMHEDFEAFESGLNISDDYVPVDTDITKQENRF
jgi:hypothetical protein